MLKKDTLGAASSKSLAEAFRCGECLHFRNHPHSTRKGLCSEEGVKATAVAPKCFTPNLTVIAQNVDQYIAVVQIFQTWNAKQQRTLLGLLKARKKKIPLGTKLYFKVGRDYISNYLCAFVAGYTSSGELMLMGSPDKSRGQAFVAFLDSQSQDLLTFTQWKAKRAQLKAENKVFDPTNRVVKKSSVKDEYEPPSIDGLSKDALRYVQRSINKGKKGRRDLVDQMSITI